MELAGNNFSAFVIHPVMACVFFGCDWASMDLTIDDFTEKEPSFDRMDKVKLCDSEGDPFASPSTSSD
eukprot:3849135-Pyramimonas_sp.AAC.1